jgi:hypothetical protein
MFGHMLVVALALARAGDPPPPSSTATSSSTASQNEARICRGGGQRTLGSHIRTRRRCLTAEQWRQEDEAERGPAPGLLVTEGQNDGHATATPR